MGRSKSSPGPTRPSTGSSTKRRATWWATRRATATPAAALLGLWFWLREQAGPEPAADIGNKLDQVGVAVEEQAQVVAAVAHALQGFVHVGADGFGVDAAEPGVAFGVDLVDDDGAAWDALDHAKTQFEIELNGVGESAEERLKLAREMFDIFDAALREAIAGAPDILFVTSAGNSDNDAEFDMMYPSSYELPNILTVGAVDQAGEETSFTTFGSNVDLHANGFEVESYVPGGDRMPMSGTSMSSPNVVNLAAKLLARNPSLSVAELREKMIAGSDQLDGGRRVLINPRATIAGK